MGLIDKAALELVEHTALGRELAHEAFDLGKQALKGTRVEKIFSQAETALLGGDAQAAQIASASRSAESAMAKAMLGRSDLPTTTHVQTLGQRVHLLNYGDGNRIALLPNGTQVTRNATAEIPYTVFKHTDGQQFVYWKNGLHAVRDADATMHVSGPFGKMTYQNARLSSDGHIVSLSRNAEIGGFNQIELESTGAQSVVDPLGIKHVSTPDGRQSIFHPDGRFSINYPNGKVLHSRLEANIPDEKLWSKWYIEKEALAGRKRLDEIDLDDNLLRQ